MKTGLTLGKFSPLHKGHQFLIETALQEMDQLYVMIYDSPETTTIPLSVRGRWIRELYPQVKIIEAWDGPTAAGYTREVMDIQDAYIRSRVHDRKITHFYSSEPYGDHVSKALNAVNRTVDVSRATVPISGTEIRQNPFAARQYLADNVYRDHVVNAVFVGAPSTGKSTIAEYLARVNNTVWMPEYGKEYWDKHQTDRRLTLEQLVEIAEGHLVREDQKLLEARNYLFTDTNVLTTRIFSYHYHATAALKLEEMALTHAARYDLYFLCDTGIPYDDTFDRSGEVNREIMQKQIVADLNCRKIPFIVLRGTVEERSTQVMNALRQFKKFDNYWGRFAGC